MRFGRVIAGTVGCAKNPLSVFLPQRGDATLVYLTIYSAQTFGIRWPRQCREAVPYLEYGFSLFT